VILTAYLDESGTHGGDSGANPASPEIVMAGMIGKSGQWQRLQSKIDKIKAEFGFSTFHAKDFKARAGQFNGWDNGKCAALASSLFEGMVDTLMHGCIVHLNREQYRTEYREGDWPRKVRWDTEYGLCFRVCAKNLVDEAVRRLHNMSNFPRLKIHFVLESGHKNAGDAERVFGELKESYASRSVDILATFSKAKKKECDHLLAADFLAFTMWRSDTESWQGVSAPSRIGRRRADITQVGFPPGTLAQLRAALLTPGLTRRTVKDASSALLSVTGSPSPLDSGIPR
jgi:hypothetical protein